VAALVMVLGHAMNPVAAAEVGVVADYRPANGRFAFTRPPHGELVPVMIGTIVVAGDRVKLDTGDSITVQLGNDEVARFRGPGDFRVPHGRPLGRLAAIFHSLPELFNDTHGWTGTAVSRGGVVDCGMSGYQPEPITVPALAPGARVAAGRRGLPLAWHGGCPPFAVTLLAGVISVAQRDSINAWQLRLDGLDLDAGRYTVHIVDSTGKRWEGAIEAVNQGPAIPADVAADNSSLGRNAQAIYIAELDDGRWRLESIERLHALVREGDPLAVALSDRLLWGSTSR